MPGPEVSMERVAVIDDFHRAFSPTEAIRKLRVAKLRWMVAS